MLSFNTERKGQLLKNGHLRTMIYPHGNTTYTVREMVIHDDIEELAVVPIMDIADTHHGISFDTGLILKRVHDFKEKAYMYRYFGANALHGMEARLYVHKDILVNYEKTIDYKETRTGVMEYHYVKFNGFKLLVKTTHVQDLNLKKEHVLHQLLQITNNIENATNTEEIESIINEMNISTS